MKKLFLAFAGVVALLIVLLVVAIAVGPSLIDLRPRVAAAVRDATGRDFRIDGPLRVALLPKIRVSAGDIHLANVPGAAAPDMLSIGSVALEAELWPLLGRRLVVNSLIVDRPVANLEVDEKGRPNWELKPKQSAQPEKPSEASNGSTSMDVQLGEFRMEHGQLSYRDAIAGQTIEAKDAELRATMPGLENPAMLTTRMTLNDAPVNGEVSIDTIGKLQRGEQARVKMALDATHATAKFDGAAQQRPVPGLDGAFDLNIPSVGQLAAWLKAPLDKAQPDPGPLQVHALFAAEGTKSVLKEATITGTGLDVKANGSFEASGEATRLAANIETGVLDIDRYLPPQARDKTAPAAPAKARDDTKPAASDPFAALSDEPFDLAALRRLDADIKVSIAGIRAMGYEVGHVAFTGKAQAGVLDADLAEIALYGGTVKGRAKLDGASDALAGDASFKVDRVAVDKFAQQAGSAPAVSGVVSATLDANGRGKSPRALAEDMRGHLAVDLGGVAIKEAAARALSQLKLAVDVPGSDKAPTLQASLVYNREPVTAAVSLAPVRALVSGDRFPAKLTVDSKLVTVRYEGAVQQKPVPGLDGTFDVDVPSVGKLAAWVGQPLDAKQPDPGLLNVHAVLASDGAKLAIKDAAVTGKAIKATAQAMLDGGAHPKVFDAKVNIEQANLDAYLPPQSTQAEKPASPSAGWSTEPIDVSALGEANGKAEITMAAIRYRGLELTRGAVMLTLAERVLTVAAEKIAVAQGTIDGTVALDGSGGGVRLDQRVVVNNLQVQPVLKAFAGTDRLSGKMHFENAVKGSGRTQKELISSLNGTGRFMMTDGAIHGIDLASALRKAGSLGFGGGQTEKTDFAELSGSYTIRSGVIENRDLKMLAPVVHVSGGGTVPLPSQTVDYAVEAKLVPSLKGQGGSDTLGGVPIPIRITGAWSNLSIQPDWSSVARGLANAPEKLKNLPGELGNAAKGLGSLPKGVLPGRSSEPPSGQPDASPDSKKSAPGPLGIQKKLFGR